MSADPLTVVEMLTRRLQLVQEISAVQSRNLLNRQHSGGAEFEVQGIEQEIAATGGSHDLAKALADARERFQMANTEMAECDTLCAELEQRLEELDGLIAAGR
ncbi:hypothetical protein [Bradyrhizobium liaoningense]|uniref:hypothetical protein n=1 Tax=Bradyrhizobium liaoningense TaxID=43992 RepID=UPI001BAE19D0|nr:hypothetical protein [Bradyrhizobium liaoningense]MBR0857088.1 hypothetical protein [Bradyrhizobium liaoningense]